MPYLTVETQHDESYWSPPYTMLMAWAATQSIPMQTGWYMEVHDEMPVRVELDVIELDPEGEWVRDPEGAPVTSRQTFTASTLPPVQGVMIRGSG